MGLLAPNGKRDSRRAGRLCRMFDRTLNARHPSPASPRDDASMRCPWVRCRTVGWVAVLLFGTTAVCSVRTEPTRIPIAVLDFDYVDTSGEMRDQSTIHSARLQQFVD